MEVFRDLLLVASPNVPATHWNQPSHFILETLEGEVSPSLRTAPAKSPARFSVTPSAGTPRNAPKTGNSNSLLRGSAPGARKGHLHLPRFACADRLRRPFGGRNPPLALATPAGVGLGQGVSQKRHSQTIQRRSRDSCQPLLPYRQSFVEATALRC